MAAPLPTRYISGFNSKLKLFYFVRMVLGEGNILTLASTREPVTINPTYYKGVQIISTFDYHKTEYLASLLFDKDGNSEDVQGIGEIDYQLNIQDGGGISGVNEAHISFLNQSRFDEFISGLDIENQDIEIWEGYIPGSPGLDINVDLDMVLRFKGVIQNAGEYDYTLFQIPCIDNRSLVTMQLPEKKITKEKFPNAPDSSIGRNLPILIGNFKSENDFTYDYGFQHYELGIPPNVVPFVLTDKYQQIYYPAEHFWQASAPPATGALYFSNGDENIICCIDNSKWGWAVDAEGIPYVQLFPDAYGSVFMRPNVIGVRHTSGLDFEEAIDSDPYTYVSLGASQRWSGSFPEFQNPGRLIEGNFQGGMGASIDIKVKIYAEDVSGTIQAIVYNKKTTGDGIIGTIVNGQNVFTYDLLAGNDNFDFIKTLDVEVLASGGASCKIRNVFVEARANYGLSETKKTIIQRRYADILTGNILRPSIYKTQLIASDSQSNIFLSTKGDVYPAWIERTSSNFPSGNGYHAGDDIFNPAYAVEWILRERLGRGDAEIDTDSFDVVGNTINGNRKNWLIAFSKSDPENGFDMIRQICFEFHMHLFNSSEGKYTLIALDDGDPVYTITSSDILSLNGKPQIRFLKTANEKVKNDIFLNYRQDYAINKPLRSIYISDVDGDGVTDMSFTSGVGTGTISSSGTGVLGTGTKFVTELKPGGFIIADGEYREVDYISSDTILHVTEAFTSPLSSDTFDYDNSGGALRSFTFKNWMEESVTRYRMRSRLDATLEYIRDDATADLALKKKASWLAFKRIVCSMSVLRNLSTLTLRVGDVLLINHDLLDVTRRNVVHFLITRINYPGVGSSPEPYINIECEEIPNENTGLPIIRHLIADESVML